MCQDYRVLWTGGFDSTYIVIDFLRRGFNVFPYYSVRGIKYQPKEIDAMSRIRKLLENHTDITGKLYPTKYLYQTENMEFYSEKLKQDVKQFGLMFQYVYLLGLVGLMDIPDGEHIALGMGGEPSHLRDLVVGKGKLCNNGIDIPVLDSNVSDPLVFQYFSKFSFPIAFITDREKYNNYLKWGYKDILDIITFCYDEHDGYICGCCAPCLVKIERGMYEFFNKDALKRNFIWHLLDKEGKKFEGNSYASWFRKYCYICSFPDAEFKTLFFPPFLRQYFSNLITSKKINKQFLLEYKGKG